METELLLNITKDNISEAQFMSSPLIDQSVKNRAFLNTLAAEAAADYLAYNGVFVDNLKNIHSIKKVLARTNIADIILSNIHIDVRTVFDKNEIFIPKDHYELDIAPHVYMILKFNGNYDNFEFLGYIKSADIKFDRSNDEYYFVDLSDLSDPKTFIDFVKGFSAETEKDLSESEILRGRELSISLSDDDITNTEYKEFLNLLLSSSILRDSVLEYDNFETLASRVADYMSKKPNLAKYSSENYQSEKNGSDTEISDSEVEIGQGLEISDSVMDFISPEINLEDNISDAVSDSAINLAALSGEISDNITLNNENENEVDENLESAESNIEDESLTEDNDLVPLNNEFEQSDIENIDIINDNINTDISNGDGIVLDDLSLEHDNLFSEIGDLSTEDLLPIDNQEEHEVGIVGEDLSLQKIDDQKTLETVSEYSNENTAVSSYEEYDPLQDENVSMYSIPTENNYANAESIDFEDLEENNINLQEPQTDDYALYDIENATAGEIDTNSQESADLQSEYSQISNEETQNWTAQEENWEATAPIEQNTQENPESESFEGFEDFSHDPDLTDNNEESVFEYDEDIENQEDIENLDTDEYTDEMEYNSPREVVITDEFLNNSVVIANSTVISDKNFEAGEIFLDINNQKLPEFDSNDMGDLGNLYNNNEINDQQAGLNNGVRISRIPAISSKYGILGLLLIIATAGVIIFSVSKINKSAQDTPQPLPDINPEKTANSQDQNDTINLDKNNIVMEDEKDKIQNSRTPRTLTQTENQQSENIKHSLKPIPPTAFLSIKKLSWEVPDYISYNEEFRQYFQSSGKSLKAALSSDLLLANDYAYSNEIKLSITYSNDGRFKEAKIISSSGSEQIDKIVLQSVNQTLNLMKAPNSLQNDESTTVILKIYL